MHKGLPIPFADYLPELMRQNPDAKVTALASKMDSIMLQALGDVVGLNDLRDPARCPADLLVELGDMLAAGILPGDSELVRRRKIASAVQGHKLRGSWAYDAKPKVDAIAGGDSKIFRSFDLDDWILVGDGTEPAAYYWAAMGADGLDLNLGISLIGSGLEVEVAGNIYIDVDNSGLTAAQVDQLVEVLRDDITPAYMYVHLGYMSGTSFVEYVMF